MADKEKLLNTLKDISYYRLSGYLFPYRQPDDSYISNTTFEKIYLHYRFDRQLRINIMDAIERVEVSVRSRLTYNFVHKYGSTRIETFTELIETKTKRKKALTQRLLTGKKRLKGFWEEWEKVHLYDIFDLEREVMVCLM